MTKMLWIGKTVPSDSVNIILHDLYLGIWGSKGKLDTLDRTSLTNAQVLPLCVGYDVIVVETSKRLAKLLAKVYPKADVFSTQPLYKETEKEYYDVCRKEMVKGFVRSGDTLIQW